MNERQKIYDEICRVLTDWETQEAVDDDLYNMLVKIQNNWESVITKEEGTNMSRIDDIKRYRQKCDEEKINKEIEKQNKIEMYKVQIKALKPRIDELLAVGNACKNNGISLEGQAWGGHEGYDTHQFITNSWSHLLGFVANRNDDFICLGIHGGGACHYNLQTNGDFIEVSGDILHILKRFVNEFDTFETEFYKYVDKVVGK